MKNKSQKTIFLFSGVIALVILSLVIVTIKVLLSDDGNKRKKQIQRVTLMKPPPPPKIKEKPPEPEVEKKEEIVEPEQEEPEPEPMEDQASDEPPPGNELGLDADGSGGSDGFGLKAKKGGRSLIGGKYDKRGLMRRYAWYTRIIQEELRKRINKYMEGNGGVPDGNLKAIVQISLDAEGNILDYLLEGTSGDNHMDEAVKKTLALAKISEPPPLGMPKTLKLKISSKG